LITGEEKSLSCDVVKLEMREIIEIVERLWREVGCCD